MTRKGFTLVEVMLTVSIITLLVTIGGYSWITLSNRAKAYKIASDFKKVESAVQEWKASTNQLYPDDKPTDDPYLDHYAFYPNYLSKIPLDPFQTLYLYDNDLDSYVLNPPGCTSDSNGYISGSGITSGVNTYLAVGTKFNDYVKIAPLVDKSLDNGDGPCNGKFRWSLGSGRQNILIYLISPTS